MVTEYDDLKIDSIKEVVRLFKNGEMIEEIAISELLVGYKYVGTV